MKKIYIVAIIMAVLTGIAIYNYAHHLEKKAEGESVAVVVASAKIPKNTVIKSTMIEVKNISVDAANSLSFKNIKDAEGKITKIDIEANEQIFTTRVTEKGSAEEGLSYAIPDGKRAITIQVDAVTGAAGFLNKGSHVDVIATVLAPSPAGGSGVPTSIMLLEDIEVIATGIYVDEAGKGDKSAAAEYTSVSLAVTADEALKLNYAATEGKIRLVLRPALDKNKYYPQPFTLNLQF